MTRWSAITRTGGRRSALAYGSRSTTAAEDNFNRLVHHQRGRYCGRCSWFRRRRYFAGIASSSPGSGRIVAACRVGPGSILRFASSCCAWRVRTRGGVACGSRASCASSACGWARPRSGRSLGAQVSGRLRGEAARRGASSSAPRRTAWWRATYLWRADRVKVWLWSQLIFGSIGWLICGGLIASKCGCGLSSSSAPSVGFREFVRTARAPRLILVRGVFAPAT